MAEIDDAVRRLTDVALMPIRRIGRYVSRFGLIAVAVTLGSFLLGAAALDGGARTVWIVLAAVFAYLSLARIVRLRWNIAKLLHNRLALERELTTAIGGTDAQERIVIEMSDGPLSDETAIRIWNEEFVAAGGPRLDPADYRWIPMAVRTAQQLGIAAIVTTFITLVFAVMGLLFLIAIALS